MQSPGHPVPPAAWRCRTGPPWFCRRPQARCSGHRLLTPPRATAEPWRRQEAAFCRRPPYTGGRNLPLKESSAADLWDTETHLASAICPLFQVDAHNIVPCWVASPKLEYAARTIRGKITKQLPEFLTEFPPVKKHPHTATRTAKVRVGVPPHLSSLSYYFVLSTKKMALMYI